MSVSAYSFMTRLNNNISNDINFAQVKRKQQKDSPLQVK